MRSSETAALRDFDRAYDRSGVMSRHPPSHSITSSARADSLGGTSMPSALAALKLMTNSNLDNGKIGRSAGFSPLKNPAVVNRSGERDRQLRRLRRSDVKKVKLLLVV